jgi:NAD(P)-dependent dehydrogenase (short-subunit alcohol dehydrogenase family)
MSMSRTGPVAFVTGAAHGQGRAAALALAAAGYHVAAFDIARPMPYPGYPMGTAEDLRGLEKEVTGLGRRALAIEGDVRRDDDVTGAVHRTVEEFGRIDLLFNNAGVAGYGLSHELSEDAWDTVLDVNLKGAWLVGRRVIPVMVEQRSGVIVNNSSVAGLRAFARLSHYTASKWALTGLTKAWAIELAPYGIRVNSIHPTGVNTPFNDGLAQLEGTTAEQVAQRSAGNLLPVPWVEPDDVVGALLYLASDAARYVTGSQLVVDAGLLTR